MMKTSISHLPANKQKEILEILEIIKEEANPEKVILFGSHARGGWVEDEYREGGINYSYISDYDFLIVIRDDNEKKEQEIISHVENKANNYKNAVSPIVHSIDYINKGLAFGQYFFTEIVKEGILLYDTGNTEFVEAKLLSPAEEKNKAQEYFNIWFPQGGEFLIDAVNAYNRGSYRNGAFYLHQAAERFYNTALLVFTGYKPKTHNLQKLRNYSKHISAELYTMFHTSLSNKHEYYLFDLLKRSYIETRYKLDYLIEKEEIQELINKVTGMQALVNKISQEKIASFR